MSQFPVDLGDDALTHRAGDRSGRARITTDPSSGLEIGVLDGYSAVTGLGRRDPHRVRRPSDWQWALDMWRALGRGDPRSPRLSRLRAGHAWPIVIRRRLWPVERPESAESDLKRDVTVCGVDPAVESARQLP